MNDSFFTNAIVGFLLGILCTGLFVWLSDQEPHENPFINRSSTTILFVEDGLYSTPKNMRYVGKYFYDKYMDPSSSKSTSLSWTPFAQNSRLFDHGIYVFCMEDEEGNTYTAEISTNIGSIYLVPKSCPTDGTCTLNKDCRNE